MMNNEENIEPLARIEIVWNRETNEANYNLAGISHEEAQRVLLAILQVNWEHALADIHNQREHNEVIDGLVCDLQSG